jgi:hypothetical protein
MRGRPQRSVEEDVDRLFALFVILCRLHETREPIERPTLSDARALLELYQVQCLGKFAWAQRVVREMFPKDRSIRGTSFHKRYRSYREARGERAFVSTRRSA